MCGSDDGASIILVYGGLNKILSSHNKFYEKVLDYNGRLNFIQAK